MIHHLHGRLVEKHPTHVVVECGGVGYYVAISLTTYDQLGDDELVKIHTHMVVREDAQLLYGFLSRSDRDMFRTLIRVNGVGPKLAGRIVNELKDKAGALPASSGGAAIAGALAQRLQRRQCWCSNYGGGSIGAAIAATVALV